MKKLDRRTLLRGAGGIAIALPFLEAMDSRPAHAQASERQRFVVFFSANGTIDDKWRPFGSGSNFSFANPNDPSELRVLAPLEAHKQDLVVIEGVDMLSRDLGPGGNGHDLGMGHMLTCRELVVGPSGVGEFSHLPDGSAGGISIDQEIANYIGNDTKFRSLEFGVRAILDTQRQITSRMCYRDAFQVLPPENDPVAAFNSIFAEVGADPMDLLEGRARRHSVLDKVIDDFNRLNVRLGQADRIKLDAHLTAIRDIEKSLDAGIGSSAFCVKPGQPPSIDPLSNDNYEQVGQLQMDLMVMALTCELTKVTSIQWSTAQSGVRFTGLGHSDSHHSLSHEADANPTARAQLVEINHWYAQRFAYLLDAMKAIPDGTGTLLDQSIVLWCNEQGNGDTHSKTEIPFVLAGSGGGALQTGRYLQYTDAAHNDLYIALLHAFGKTDAVSFGLPQLSTGPLSGVL